MEMELCYKLSHQSTLIDTPWSQFLLIIIAIFPDIGTNYLQTGVSLTAGQPTRTRCHMAPFQERSIMLHKYLGYLHKTSATVLTIFSTMTQAKFHLSSIIIVRVSLFGYVIYFIGDAHCQQCASPGE